MNILCTNDDGYLAQGITVLSNAAARFGITVGDVSHDFEKVIAKSRTVAGTPKRSITGCAQ